MFASAAREVVFSNPEVVRRIQNDFVPVALKAALVNNPPGGIEGRLYAEIGRSKPAPQGICVANSDGKALAWALSFDDDDSIAGFLDYAVDRYREFPGAMKPVTTERFRRYPGHKLPDITDTGGKISAPTQHADDDRCPGRPAVEQGSLVGRVIGRALDADGRPLADTVRQEHYMEARFEIPPTIQHRFVAAAREADGKKFQLSDELPRSLVGPAHLGQLDVNPLGEVPGSANDRYESALFATRVPSESERIRFRIDGKSDVEGSQDSRGKPRGGGRLWEHRVTLEWEGYIDVQGDQVTQLVMLAHGSERLRWGNARLKLTTEPAAAHLMAGHPIDMDCGARYGLIAEPARADEIVDTAARPAGGNRQTMDRIRGKMQRVQAGIQRRRQAGRDMAPIAELMQQFGPLMQRQKLDEAEAIIDRLLKLLDDGARGAK